MSLRTFARRFRDEVGMSPRPLADPAAGRAGPAPAGDPPTCRWTGSPGEVGFATATSLRQHLQAAIGVSPLAYRRTFRAADAEPVPAGTG